MTPFFSIIVPVYNVEKYLRECVDSILSQSFRDFELILVDDGSPDGCPEICDTYASSDPRVRVIHKSNGGISSARNAGLNVSNGVYALFIDSDDYIYPDSLSKIYTAAQSCQYDVICYNHETHTPKGIMTHTSHSYSGNINDQLLLSIAYAGICKSPEACIDVSVFNKAYDLNIINKHNLRFDETMPTAEDILFNSAFFPLAHTVNVLPDILYYYRFNVLSLSKSPRPFDEHGMERSVYFLSVIYNNLLKRVPRELVTPASSIRLIRIVIDVCSNLNKSGHSLKKRITFIKKTTDWFWKYIRIYNMDIIKPSGFKPILEYYLLKNKLIIPLEIYTRFISLYRRIRHN